MKNSAEKPDRVTGPDRKKKPVFWQVFSVSVLYHFIYCLLGSESLVGFPIVGGSLYLFGRASVLFTGMQRPPRSLVLTRRERIVTWCLLVPMLLLPLAMTVLPIRLSEPALWVLFALAALLTLRITAAQFLMEKDLMQGRPVRKAFRRLVILEVLFIAPLPFLFFFCLDTTTALSMLLGAVLGAAMEVAELWRERQALRAAPENPEEFKALRGVVAYRRFQDVTVIIAAALQVTMAFEFALLATLADTLLAAMAMTAFLLAAVILADLVCRRIESEKSDPGNILIMGVAVWLYGIVWFIRVFDSFSPGDAYIAVALSALGGTICVRTLGYMDTRMRDVASFALQHPATRTYDWALRTRTELSSLAGQVVALIGLTLLDIFAAGRLPDTLPALISSVRPVLTLPVLILVLLALVAAIRFPLTSGHMAKLERYMGLSREGESNEALRQQLEKVILQKSLKHYGVRIIIHLLRPLYHHRVVGKDRVHMDPQGAAVFVCNHGEIYGPIAATLFVPYSFRPWVTHQMVDKQEISEYLYETNFKRQKWIPKGLRRGLATRFAGPILAWLIGSLEPIPVYINDPAKLRITFRETVNAMTAGDNILLFPENSATSETKHYVREGVSDFFTGFAMIGQLYYRRTGLKCQFIPVYCNQKKRTVSFGESVRYDTQLPPAEEAKRLAEALQGQIMALAKGD